MCTSKLASLADFMPIHASKQTHKSLDETEREVSGQMKIYYVDMRPRMKKRLRRD